MYISNDEHWLFDNVTSLKDLDSERLMRLIEQASYEVDEYCNTRFLPTEDIYLRDFAERFNTRRRPLRHVTALILEGAELEEDTDFFVYSESERVELCRHLKSDRCRKALEIRYIYGHGTVPATVKQVIVELIKLDVETGGVRLDGLQSENWDSEYQYSRQSSKDLTPSELRKNVLSRLDRFIEEPYMETEPRRERAVKARLL